MRSDLGFESVRVRAVTKIELTSLRGDGESGGHRKAEFGHLGKVRPFATEQVGHRAVAVAEVVDIHLPRSHHANA